MNEILHRNSEASYKSHRAGSPGIQEAFHPNMAKHPHSPSLASGVPYGPAAYKYPDTDASYRSASPPIDERTGMNPMAWGPGSQTTRGPDSFVSSGSGTLSFGRYYDEGLQTFDTNIMK
jgi:hypothetical protein